MPTKEQSQQDLDNYRQAVHDVAEDVVAELIDADTDTDRDELLTQLINERCDQHDYVINDELQIHTLLYSDHPCAGFFNGTFSGQGRNSTDAFPFAELAADALEVDVNAKVRELLEEDDA